MTNVSSGPAPQLERVIGVGGLGASAVNFIVGSGIFGLPGIAAAMLGPAAVLAYLVCAVLAGLVGLCLAEVGSRVSHPGGLYGYATAGYGAARARPDAEEDARVERALRSLPRVGRGRTCRHVAALGGARANDSGIAARRRERDQLRQSRRHTAQIAAIRATGRRQIWPSNAWLSIW